MTRQMLWAAALSAIFVVSGCAWLNRPDPLDPYLEVGSAPAGRFGAWPSPPRDGIVRFVTFNVHGAPGRALVRAFRASEDLREADIVLLQEVEHHGGAWSGAAVMLADSLGMHYAYAPGYGLRGGGSHGVAILSRFPLRDVSTIELPYNWVHVNSARRVALAATAHIAGTPLRLYTVHLDNRVNPARRIAQLAPVLDDAARWRHLPTLVGGDVNTNPFCWLAHLIPIPCGRQTTCLERHLRGRGFATPVTASGATSEWLGMRLDAFYTRNLQVVDFAVERDVRISDHLPLWLDIR